MSLQDEPVKNGVRVKRVRFPVGIEETQGDYRPVTWPIPHPYWCSGRSDTDFFLVAYVENEAQLKAQWPEARAIEVFEEDLDHYTFTGRFSKPDWFV